MKSPLNSTVGDDALCAWQPVPGVVWVQTRSPHHARRLAKRADGGLVMTGVAGGYLRTYEFRHSLAWAVRLIRRYLSADMTAGEPIIRPAGRGRTPGAVRVPGLPTPLRNAPLVEPVPQ